jgi:FlaA1/EpsC-like NDP-sugar epimerase
MVSDALFTLLILLLCFSPAFGGLRAMLSAPLDFPWLQSEPRTVPFAVLGLLTLTAALAPFTSWAFGLYKIILRHVSLFMFTVAVLVVLILIAAMMVVDTMTPSADFQLRTYGLAGMLIFCALCGPRLAFVALYQTSRRPTGKAHRLLVYGAGQAGLSLAMSIRSTMTHQVVAFLDDDPSLQGRELLDLPVFAPAQAEHVISEMEIQTVVVALPSVGLNRRRQVIAQLADYPVQLRTLPGIDDLLNRDHITLNQVRDIEPEDLLWRDVVAPGDDLLGRDIRGRTVLVTGAGGSIGSEICRLVLTLHATKLIILDHSEFDIYTIDRELRERIAANGLSLRLETILGDVGERPMLAALLAAHQVDIIFHAAAYKHVPMVEHNPLAGLRTNALGTYHVAQAARHAGVGKMVLISTDKAVRPTNIMGASKRMAEQILQALSDLPAPPGVSTKTCFTMVRFGNVLGSKGSVVPLFRQQIAAGGPVTLTHRDITRYFMTIPEAVQLVLQAGAMAQSGDLFVLDMGEPIRIYDLASRLIRLSGYSVRDEDHPEGDISIEVVGLRPGEKLYEELLISADICPSEHPLIMRAREGFMPWDLLNKQLQALQTALDQYAPEPALTVLQTVVPEYSAFSSCAETSPCDASLAGFTRDVTAP